MATQDDKKNGIAKGQHRRYLKAHQHRGVPRTSEVRRKLSIAHKGKRTGAANARWSGGLQMRRGRLHRFVGIDHPMAHASGYAPEYRLVMAEKIGRYLKPTEHVHHVDLDPTNNDLANLVLLTASQHMRIHRLIRLKGAKPRDALAYVLEQQDV